MSNTFFTRAPSTIVTIDNNGQTELTIPFEFLARKFVVVTLIGVDRKVLTINTDYRFIAVNKIRLEQPASANYTRIELRRVTSTTDRLVSFIDGSILRASDLNLAQVQTMHVAEEARDLTSDTIGVNDDGHLDARGRRIVNLADAVDNNDAVNLGMLRKFDTSTGTNADRAAVSAAQAKESEQNAAGSEARCVIAEAKSTSSAGTAMTAAADANRSKVEAKDALDKITPMVPIVVNNATQAQQSADRAEAAALKAEGLLKPAVVNFTEFGLVGDGVVDDTDAFIRAVNSANASGDKLVASGKHIIKLTGSQLIDIKCSIDFNGATVDLRGFSGKLGFSRSQTPVTYDASSPVVQALKSTQTITGSYISGWRDVSEVEDSFIRIETSQPFYYYRGNIRTRVEFNKVARNGVLESSFKYPLDTSTVVSVTVYPMEKRWTTISNVSFNLGSNDIGAEFLKIESSLLKANNIRFIQDNFVNQVRNQTLFSVINSCNVVLEDIVFEWATRSNATTGYTYNFSMSGCYNIRSIRMSGTGDGWGATGSNSSQKVYFESCTLSRIDFHEPFREVLSMRDCHVGSWGVLVTALGDLLIEGGSMVWDARPYINNNGYIRSRGDTNGFCDGNLIIKNVVFRGDSTSTRKLLGHQRETDQGAVAGSPINFIWWNTITLEGLRYEAPTLSTLDLSPVPVINSNIKMCQRMVIKDCLNGRFVFLCGWNSGVLPSTPSSDASKGGLNRPNFTINAVNSMLDIFSIADRDPTRRFVIHASLDGCRSSIYNNEEMELEGNFGGTLSVNNSSIVGIDFYSGGSPLSPLFCNVTNSRILHNGEKNPTVVNGINSNVRLTTDGCTITTTSMNSLRTLLLGQARNNNYYIDRVFSPIEISLAENIGTTPVSLAPAGIDARNTAMLVVGFDSDKSTQLIPFRLPTPDRSIFVPTTTTSGVVITRSADGTTVTATNVGNGPQPRRISLRP